MRGHFQVAGDLVDEAELVCFFGRHPRFRVHHFANLGAGESGLAGESDLDCLLDFVHDVGLLPEFVGVAAH